MGRRKKAPPRRRKPAATATTLLTSRFVLHAKAHGKTHSAILDVAPISRSTLKRTLRVHNVTCTARASVQGQNRRNDKRWIFAGPEGEANLARLESVKQAGASRRSAPRRRPCSARSRVCPAPHRPSSARCTARWRAARRCRRRRRRARRRRRRQARHRQARRHEPAESRLSLAPQGGPVVQGWAQGWDWTGLGPGPRRRAGLGTEQGRGWSRAGAGTGLAPKEEWARAGIRAGAWAGWQASGLGWMGYKRPRRDAALASSSSAAGPLHLLSRGAEVKAASRQAALPSSGAVPIAVQEVRGLIAVESAPGVGRGGAILSRRRRGSGLEEGLAHHGREGGRLVRQLARAGAWPRGRRRA